MAELTAGRTTATVPEGAVVFLIGMRINRLRKLRSWLPPFLGMPKMLKELSLDPSLGFLGHRLCFSGRLILVVQYWRDAESLLAYAGSPDRAHLPAWRAFNQRVRRAAGDVGIFHETYVLGAHAAESVYVQMPTVLAAAAFGSTEIVPARDRAAQRLAG